MKMPIPISAGDRLFTDVEVDAPKSSAIADTRKLSDGGNTYGAISRFVSGGVRYFTDTEGNVEEDPIKVQSLCKQMPYKTAEYLAIMIAVAIDGDDGFEGYYVCPRCGKAIVREYVSEDDDTRDRISDLHVEYAPEEPLVHEFVLEYPVEVKDKKSGDTLFSVDNFSMYPPTMAIAEKSKGRYGATDDERRQFAMYVDSLVMVNGEEVSGKWRGEWGMFVFENMDSRDRKRLFAEVSKYGIDQRIPVVCTKCGKSWKARVNTSNFFESALLSE